MSLRSSLRLNLGCGVAVTVLNFLFAGAVLAASNPVPTVVGPPVPQAVLPGKGQFTLKVYGANFVQGAGVNWNRSPRFTTFVSARELHANILAADVAKPTAGYITVTNPPPGGGVSSSSYAIVEVHQPTKTIVVGRPDVYLNNIGARLSVLSDFNNDGILDFAADYGFKWIKAFLGNGDGSFRQSSTVTSNYYGNGPAVIAAGDFNNDGNEDLLFGADFNGPPTQLEVNFGDGNGKFRFGVRSPFKFENYPWGVTIGDFNRDGNLDAAVAAAEPGYYLSIFLGNGDGTFKQGATYQDVGAYEMVTADFNGDGILDLAVLDSTSRGNLFIQLGNGDGTFQQPRLVDRNPLAGTCSLSADLWVSDFNGDGRADLAYCERDLDANQGKIWVALGNGDGTFKKPVSLTVDAYQGAFEFAVGDFNSDGKTDILANYFLANNFNKTETDLFLGNGDGTFQRKKIITLPGEPFYNAENGIVPGDFNSDGLLDFLLKEPGAFNVFVQK
jgi:hypothetical protein